MFAPDDQSLLPPSLKAVFYSRRFKLMIHMLDCTPSWATMIDESCIEVPGNSQMSGVSRG